MPLVALLVGAQSPLLRQMLPNVQQEVGGLSSNFLLSRVGHQLKSDIFGLELIWV